MRLAAIWLPLLQGSAAPALPEFVPTLPAPTGPHSLGSSIHFLEDPSRTYAFDPVRTRELRFQVWYPAEPGRGAALPYLPELELLDALQGWRYMDLDPDVLGSWSDLATHSRRDAPLASSPEPLPLLFFSPGLGMARASYTSLCEELASHGYVVVAIDHPYAGATVLPGGRALSTGDDPRGEEASGTRVDELARDARFLLDALLDPSGALARFAGRIDAGRVGMLGHSLGGAAALEAARLDPRFRACADLDGHPFGAVAETGLARPCLVLLNEPEKSKRPPPEMKRERRAVWANLARRGTAPISVATIENTNHFTFSDMPFVAPPALMARSGGVLAPERGLAIQSRLLRAYFAAELGVMGGETLAEAADAWPEVTLEVLTP